MSCPDLTTKGGNPHPSPAQSAQPQIQGGSFSSSLHHFYLIKLCGMP